MDETLTTVLRAAALALAALLPVINPPGVAPVFLSLTEGASDHVRSVAAARVARNAFVLIVAAMLGGSSILLLFGLTLAEIRIAGGLLVIATGWRLMHTDQRPDASLVALSHLESTAHTLYPLTFPVTIGPGSVSIALTLGAGAREGPGLAALVGLVAGTVLVSVIVYLCYRFAARVARRLGDAGTLVLLRLSAFVLLSVGVKIFCDGLVERFTAGSA